MSEHDEEASDEGAPPRAQEQFVREQVAQGRYRTASEVVRHGLRLLEEAEHRRLVEKWIYEDLSDEELARLPPALKARVQEYFKNLVEDGLGSAEEGGWIEGSVALETMRKKPAAVVDRPSARR